MDSNNDRTSHPHSKFTGLAQVYASARPTYPAASIDSIVSDCHLKKGALVVDIGCGTGISSRLFAERGFRVIGIEPNEDMRNQAEQEHQQADWQLSYQPGSAEDTRLAAGTVDLVIAAQAFHWFDPAPTLAEFKRILKPGGHVALIWNERMETDPFTHAYGNALRRWAKDTKTVESNRANAAEPFLESALFTDYQVRKFENYQTLDEAGVLGRVFSTSYAPKESADRDALTAELKEIVSENSSGGLVRMHYLTTVYLGRLVS